MNDTTQDRVRTTSVTVWPTRPDLFHGMTYTIGKTARGSLTVTPGTDIAGTAEQLRDLAGALIDLAVQVEQVDVEQVTT